MVFRTAIQQIPKRNQFLVRQFQRDAKEGFQTRTQRVVERQTLRERAMAPPGPNGEQTKNFHLHQISFYSFYSVCFG